VSISIIDGTEENHVEIDKMNLEIDSMINKIKTVFEDKIDDILLNEPGKLKDFLNALSNQIRSISENYLQNINFE
jgi:hypothetical protein